MACSACVLCNREIGESDEHAELNLTVWAGGDADARRENIITLCRFCSTEAGLLESGRPRARVVGLARLLIEKNAVEPEREDSQERHLEAYEPETGLTDDGMELAVDDPMVPKNRENLH